MIADFFLSPVLKIVLGVTSSLLVAYCIWSLFSKTFALSKRKKVVNGIMAMVFVFIAIFCFWAFVVTTAETAEFEEIRAAEQILSFVMLF